MGQIDSNFTAINNNNDTECIMIRNNSITTITVSYNNISKKLSPTEGTYFKVRQGWSILIRHGDYPHRIVDRKTYMRFREIVIQSTDTSKNNIIYIMDNIKYNTQIVNETNLKIPIRNIDENLIYLHPNNYYEYKSIQEIYTHKGSAINYNSYVSKDDILSRQIQIIDGLQFNLSLVNPTTTKIKIIYATE